MKFLIAEDDDDLREILVFLISSNYSVEVFQAVDGENAIQIMNEEGPFDLVMSDYNMPRKNGGEVYAELRRTQPQVPFMLVSTEIDLFKRLVPDPTFYSWISKPFDESEITGKIESIFSEKQLPMVRDSYLPISIDLLEKVEVPGVAIYLKLNKSQFVKVLKSNAIFDKNEYIRFKNKKVTHLYIEVPDLKPFIGSFRKNVFAKLAWEEIDTTDAMAGLENDWGLILQGSRAFGWPDSLTEYAKENIARTISLINKNPDINRILEGLKISNSKSHIYSHCYTLVFLTTAILNELSWNSSASIQKMTFACLMHDMDLSESSFAEKLELIKNDKLQTEVIKNMRELAQSTNQAHYLIYNHANTAADFVSNWSSCPADVSRLIAQHHERFDGTGFPQKLNFLNLFPLAGVFIIAEDIIYHKINFPEAKLSEFLKKHEEYYNRGDFKQVYAAALKAVESAV